MKLRAKFLLILMGAALIGGIFYTRAPIKIETKLTALLTDETQKNTPVQSILNTYSDSIQVVFEATDFNAAKNAADTFLNALNPQDFTDITYQIMPAHPKEIVRELSRYQGGLLNNADRQLLQAQDFNTIRNQAVNEISNAVTPFMLPVSQDPFLLFSHYIGDLVQPQGNWSVKNGVMWQHQGNSDFILMILRPVNTSFNQLNKNVIAVKQTADKIRAVNTAVKIHLSGAVLHSVRTTQKSKTEINILSAISISCAVFFMYCLFKKIRYVFPIMAIMAISFLIAGTVVILCFDSPHILMAVFATSLIGLSIDYSFHYISALNDKHYDLIRRNIRHALITTLICFTPLLFSSLPILRQLAVFTMTGLVSVYTLIIFFFNQLSAPPPSKPMTVPHLPVKFKTSLLSIFGILAVIGFATADYKNNMSAIYRPDTDLESAEKFMANLNGGTKTHLLIISGSTLETVLQTAESLNETTPFFSLATLIPSQKRQSENTALIKKLYETELASLQKEIGLKSMPIYNETDFLTADKIQNESLKRLIKSVLIQDDNGIHITAQISKKDLPLPENVQYFSPKDFLQKHLNTYSNETHKMVIFSCIGLFATVILLYRTRAFLYIAIPFIGIGMTLFILTLSGISISFFHTLGLFIVLGLGMDYAIFHLNYQFGQDIKPVLFSFLTSFVGFGLLSFSGFALIQSLGMVISIGLACVYIIATLAYPDKR